MVLVELGNVFLMTMRLNFCLFSLTLQQLPGSSQPIIITIPQSPSGGAGATVSLGDVRLGSSGLVNYLPLTDPVSRFFLCLWRVSMAELSPAILNVLYSFGYFLFCA